MFSVNGTECYTSRVFYIWYSGQLRLRLPTLKGYDGTKSDGCRPRRCARVRTAHWANKARPNLTDVGRADQLVLRTAHWTNKTRPSPTDVGRADARVRERLIGQIRRKVRCPSFLRQQAWIIGWGLAPEYVRPGGGDDSFFTFIFLQSQSPNLQFQKK